MKYLVVALAIMFAAPAAAQKLIDPAQFVNSAFSIAQAIDRNQTAQIWDGASTAMKNLAPKDRFVATVQQSQKSLGPVRARDWVAISRTTVTAQSNGVPAGQYLTVTFVSLGNGNRAIREAVSFILDGDANWRLAGYTME